MELRHVCRRPSDAPCLLSLLLLGLALCAPAQAADAPYLWADTDAQAQLHSSTQLAEVPEPFLGMYRAQAAARGAPRDDAQGPSRGQPAIRQQYDQRRTLRREVQRWRDELQAALRALVQADAEVNQAQFNPILRQTPEGRSQADAAGEARRRAAGRLRLAVNKLQVDIPERAQKAHLPPSWLQ